MAEHTVACAVAIETLMLFIVGMRVDPLLVSWLPKLTEILWPGFIVLRFTFSTLCSIANLFGQESINDTCGFVQAGKSSEFVISSV